MEEPHASSASSSKPPTFQRALVSGAISGVAVDFLFFPLDTIKTRIQSTKGFWHSGGFKGVYRGIGSVGMGTAIFFVSYETFKAALPRHSSFLADSPSITHVVAASGAEFLSCLVRVPTEIIKSRTQTGAYGHGKGKGSINSALSTLRYDGPKGFFRGFGMTIARDIPFTAIQFPLYEALKSFLSRNYLDGRRPTPGEAAICGSIAGGFASAVTTPLDVVKTRVMLEARTHMSPTAGPLEPVPSPSILSFLPRLLGILRNEGLGTLYSGWAPRTFAISMGGAVFLGIYDFASNFGKENPPDSQHLK
ncbi:Putative mitochondrial carrier protein PET8 [Saitozyma sp. JCM 24511]|nr:Putative mitochondrial carrier protein PET8 [Saitozyma sp. JCM 24511]